MRKKEYNLGLAFALGTSVGTAIGTALKSLPMGIAITVAMIIVFYQAFKKQRCGKDTHASQ
ncbi:MAG: hypothetical protein K9N11_06980 [Lentisphaeria bacterium]|nr:hypothetical protein [Candidatus Neomarinimicrobiota bacterium]MCF7842580.1 hypothetical protein [Lentisphaeria bacterium]